MRLALSTSKASTSDVVSPISKQHHTLETKCPNGWAYGAHSHSGPHILRITMQNASSPASKVRIVFNSLNTDEKLKVPTPCEIEK